MCLMSLTQIARLDSFNTTPTTPVWISQQWFGIDFSLLIRSTSISNIYATTALKHKQIMKSGKWNLLYRSLIRMLLFLTTLLWRIVYRVVGNPLLLELLIAQALFFGMFCCCGGGGVNHKELLASKLQSYIVCDIIPAESKQFLQDPWFPNTNSQALYCL